MIVDGVVEQNRVFFYLFIREVFDYYGRNVV